MEENLGGKLTLGLELKEIRIFVFKHFTQFWHKSEKLLYATPMDTRRNQLIHRSDRFPIEMESTPHIVASNFQEYSCNR